MADIDTAPDKCPACDARLTAGDVVCPECGLTLAPEALPKELMVCPACGREYTEPTTTCACGYDFERNRDSVEVARTWKRLVNFAIDIVACYVAAWLLTPVGVALSIAIASVPDSLPFPVALLLVPVALLVPVVWSMSIFFCYYFIMEALFQRTLGKLVSRTKVVMMDGHSPSPRVLAKRTLIRLIPFEFLSIGFGSLWHDWWSGTRVVDT